MGGGGGVGRWGEYSEVNPNIERNPDISPSCCLVLATVLQISWGGGRGGKDTLLHPQGFYTNKLLHFTSIKHHKLGFTVSMTLQSFFAYLHETEIIFENTLAYKLVAQMGKNHEEIS